MVNHEVVNVDIVHAVSRGVKTCCAMGARADLFTASDDCAAMRLTNAEERSLILGVITCFLTRSLSWVSHGLGRQRKDVRYTLHLLKDTYNLVYTTPGSAVKACVATSTAEKAATAFGGTTLHSALNISIYKDDTGLRYSDLNTCRGGFESLKFIICRPRQYDGFGSAGKMDNRIRKITQQFYQSLAISTSIWAETSASYHPPRPQRCTVVVHAKSANSAASAHGKACSTSRRARLRDGANLTDDVCMIERRSVTAKEAAKKCRNGIRLSTGTTGGVWKTATKIS
ncbi:hypothetical protein HPB49_016301 [Dermacentor silvarum]|uniref:Uncharacterized protein n=1 Tax=Dermacentor silvarum TaxID=543639 RepID=A0ACB8CG06_DERSI|nr:hypothetical protein HPB49_016301 [Dermacentor silvarum]